MTVIHVTCRSGERGWQCRLRANYASFEEFAAYDEIYGLAERLGFPSAESAWDLNPMIQGSTNPSDFRRICSPTKHRKQLRKRGLLVLLLCLFLPPAAAQARPPYLEAFAKLYKVDTEKPETVEQQDLRGRLSAVRCNACHVPNRPKTERNEYGDTLHGLLPAYDDNAFRDPKRSGGAYQEVYKALKAAEAEVGSHRYRFGDLIKNGYLPMYDK